MATIPPGRSKLMAAVRQLEAQEAKASRKKTPELPPALPDFKGIRTPHERRKAAAPLPPGQAAELAAAKKTAAKKKARKK